MRLIAWRNRLAAEIFVQPIAQEIEALFLKIHRRNGGQLSALDFRLRLLDPGLAIDSLDLAEIIAACEARFGRSPFDTPSPPQSWEDLVRIVSNGEAESRC